MTKNSKSLLGVLLILIALTHSVGCTDPSAAFSESSDINIPAPTFSGKTEHQIIIASPLTNILVKGECDSRTKALTTMIEGVSNWTTIESIASDTPTVNCKENTFTFHLPSLKSMNKFSPGKKVTFQLKAKALTIAGYSSASTLTVVYDPKGKTGGNLPGFVVSPVGGFSSSTSFQLKNRLSSVGTGEVQGTHFTLQSGFKATSQ